MTSAPQTTMMVQLPLGRQKQVYQILHSSQHRIIVLSEVGTEKTCHELLFSGKTGTKGHHGGGARFIKLNGNKLTEICEWTHLAFNQ